MRRHAGRRDHGAACRARIDALVAVARDQPPSSEHPRFDDVYPELLFRTYCIAKASVPLMAAASAETTKRSAPALRPYCTYLARHIEQEHAHDDWLLEDLAVLGVTTEDVSRRSVPESIAAGVGAQYYRIYHVHPTALLGHMLALEGSFPSEGVLRAAMARSRHPPGAFRTLLHHADQDRAHAQDIRQLLDELALDSVNWSAVEDSLKSTLHMLAASSREVFGGLPSFRRWFL